LKGHAIDYLMNKIIRGYQQLRGIREGRIERNIFKKVGSLSPIQIKVSNYHRRVISSFNPSAVTDSRNLHLFIRLIFDYYDYVSSVAYTAIPLELIEDLPKMELLTKLIIYPTTPNEIKRGSEDPRAHLFRDDFLIFYTAVGLRDGGLWPKQGFALLDGVTLEVKRKGIMYLKEDDKLLLLPSWKNTTLLKDDESSLTILTRPFIEGHEIIWNAKALDKDKEKLIVDYKDMEVTMVHEEFEVKVGISTPPVQIELNKYLFGWHGIRSDMVYLNGLAVVDGKGRLLGVTEYLLEPSTLDELYGDRPMVIYGSGLIKRDDEIFWIGGTADCCIGIYKAKLDEILSIMKWLH